MSDPGSAGGDDRSKARLAQERRRWRLIVGDRGDDPSGEGRHSLPAVRLDQGDARMDRALSLVYGHGAEALYARRMPAGRGGCEDPRPFLPLWLDDLRTCFPRPAKEVLESDGLTTRGFSEILLQPEYLESVEASVPLAIQLLSLKDLVPARAKEIARAMVRRVTRQIEEEIRDKLERAVVGSPVRHRHTRVGPLSRLDWKRTIRANLRHFQPTVGTIVPETIHFFDSESRTKDATPWNVIILVDESGSMVESLVYTSVAASVLASLRSLCTRLLLFSSSVVDMSDHVDDPVDILFGATLSGGTAIADAIEYAARLVIDPKRTLLALVSDLEENGDDEGLVQGLGALRHRGVTVLCMLGMTNQSTPRFNRKTASRVARLGIPTFCATPDRFARTLGCVLDGRPIPHLDDSSGD